MGFLYTLVVRRPFESLITDVSRKGMLLSFSVSMVKRIVACWLEPGKQEGIVYRILCECGKVYIGETGRAMQDRIKEHDRDIRLAHTQTSAVSEHANETGHLPLWNPVKFIDRHPH